MSRESKTVTRAVFEPGTYSSRWTRLAELRVDVHLPPPGGPFDVLRFNIGGAGETIHVTVHFGAPAEIGPRAIESAAS